MAMGANNTENAVRYKRPLTRRLNIIATSMQGNCQLTAVPEFVVSRRLPSPPPKEVADGVAEDPDPDAEGRLEVE